MFAGLSIAVLLHFFANQGPTYEGKDISYWFKIANPPQPMRVNEIDWRALKAFRKMDSAAVPYLRDQLRRQDLLATIYWNAWFKLPPRIQKRLGFPKSPTAKQARAARLLGVIGYPGAQPAVPDLIAAYDRCFALRYDLPPNAPLDWSLLLTNPPSSLLSNYAAMPTPGAGRIGLIFTGDLRGIIYEDLIGIGGDNKELIPLVLTAAREPGPGPVGAIPFFDTSAMSNSCLSLPVARAESSVLAALQLPEQRPFTLSNAISRRSTRLIRECAGTLLGSLLPAHAEVVPALTKALRDGDVQVRRNAARSLGAAQTDLEPVVSGLGELLVDDETRAAGVEALSKLAEHSETAVSLMIALLSHTNDDVREGVAQSLGNAGPNAKGALPKLAELTRESNERRLQVRYQAAEALWKIDHQAYAILPFRLAALRSPEELARWAAASFLGEAGAQAEAAVPALIEMLEKDPSNRLKGEAANALGKIGPGAKSAVPALRLAALQEDTDIRDAAREALKKIEPRQ